MPVILSITSFQAQSMGEEAEAHFGPEGGSFGRATGNDWILPDPMRHISSKHGTISFREGHYWLADTSTNGIFVNNAPTPLGRGSEIALNNGDQLTFGDYVITVTLEADSPKNDIPLTPPNATFPPDPTPPSANLLDDVSLGNNDLGQNLDPMELMSQAGSQPPASPSSVKPPVDPMELLGGNSAIPEDNSINFEDDAKEWGTASDHASADQGYFTPPSAAPEENRNIIPDDWDLGGDDFVEEQKPIQPPAAPTAPPQSQVEQQTRESDVDPLSLLDDSEPQKPAPESTPRSAAESAAPASAPEAPPPPPAASDSELYAAFLKGMGVEDNSTNENDLPSKMEELGGLFRLMVGGMMEVLQARASLKSEFRMDMTMIQAAENNPLKFSPTPDEAIFNLFFRKSASYLTPKQSLEEGFKDIRNHQLAMVAAMQEAFQGMLLKLEPSRFENQDATGTLKALNRKSRLWDSYQEFFNRLDEDPEARFQQLFGSEFASAYEKQISRLDSYEG